MSIPEFSWPVERRAIYPDDDLRDAHWTDRDDEVERFLNSPRCLLLDELTADSGTWTNSGTAYTFDAFPMPQVSPARPLVLTFKAAKVAASGTTLPTYLLMALQGQPDGGSFTEFARFRSVLILNTGDNPGVFWQANIADNSVLPVHSSVVFRIACSQPTGQGQFQQGGTETAFFRAEVIA